MYEIFGLDTRIFFLMWCTGFWLYLDQFEFLFYSRSFHSLFKRITENFLFLRYYKWLSNMFCILYISWNKWLLTIQRLYNNITKFSYPNSIASETDCISYAHKLIVPYPQFMHDEINKAKKPGTYSLLNCHESSNIYSMQLCIWNVL